MLSILMEGSHTQGGGIVENLGIPRVKNDFFQNASILLLVYPQTQVTNSDS